LANKVCHTYNQIAIFLVPNPQFNQFKGENEGSS